MSGARILHFTVGPRRFALPVTEIMEIRELTDATPVPGAPSVIAGLVEIRGRVVTLVDLAEVYSLPAVRKGPMMVVQFADPLGHLGIAIPSGPQDLETDEAAEQAGDEGDAPLDGGDADLADDAGFGDSGGRGDGPAAREILLCGARPALLLDAGALADYCTLRVRDRFKILE